MGSDRIRFIKGHMGGNEIILLYGSQLDKTMNVKRVLPLLNPPHIRADQVGWLIGSANTNELKVKIVDRSYRDYLEMCGGLTQVLGKAIAETDLTDYYDLRLDSNRTIIDLKTAVGSVPLEISTGQDSATVTYTNMNQFVKRCYQQGVEATSLANTKVTKVSSFLVVQGEELSKNFPEADLSRMERDKTRHPLLKIQTAFSGKYLDEHETNADYSVFDLKSSDQTGRLIFPHHISTGHVEPACGTGTIAVGIAMAEQNLLPPDKKKIKLTFEAGGEGRSIGGPDSSTLILSIEEGKITDAAFSHSRVELLAQGQVHI